MLQDAHGRPYAHRRLRALCRTLLKRMAPEHKFATAARLCSEVLSGFADGALSLGGAPEVLRDALHILASKDVKVGARLGHALLEPPASPSPLRGAFLLPAQCLPGPITIIWAVPGALAPFMIGATHRSPSISAHGLQVTASKGGADEDEAATAGSMAHAAKGKLVSSMMKKYLAEAMVPMLLELKRALEVARHPLLGQLLATLRALLKEHKHEVRTLWLFLTRLCTPSPQMDAIYKLHCGMTPCPVGSSVTKGIVQKTESAWQRKVQRMQMHDILGGDKQLAQELLHDMKQQAASQKQAAAAPAPAAAAPAHAPPSAAGASLRPGPGQQGGRRPSRLQLETFSSPSPHGACLCRACDQLQQPCAASYAPHCHVG